MQLQNSKTNPLLHPEEMKRELFLIINQEGVDERMYFLLMISEMQGERRSKLVGMPKMTDSADPANPLSGAKKNEI